MKRSIFQWIYNKNMTEEEVGIWDTLKKTIDGETTPKKKIIAAFTTIRDVCNKRKKAGKKDTGLNKLLKNLESADTLSEQIKILHKGKGTGWGSAWDRELKKKFENLSVNEDNDNPVQLISLDEFSGTPTGDNNIEYHIDDNSTKGNKIHENNNILNYDSNTSRITFGNLNDYPKNDTDDNNFNLLGDDEIKSTKSKKDDIKQKFADVGDGIYCFESEDEKTKFYIAFGHFKYDTNLIAPPPSFAIYDSNENKLKETIQNLNLKISNKKSRNFSICSMNLLKSIKKDLNVLNDDDDRINFFTFSTGAFRFYQAGESYKCDFNYEHEGFWSSCYKPDNKPKEKKEMKNDNSGKNENIKQAPVLGISEIGFTNPIYIAFGRFGGVKEGDYKYAPFFVIYDNDRDQLSKTIQQMQISAGQEYTKPYFSDHLDAIVKKINNEFGLKIEKKDFSYYEKSQILTFDNALKLDSQYNNDHKGFYSSCYNSEIESKKVKSN